MLDRGISGGHPMLVEPLTETRIYEIQWKKKDQRSGDAGKLSLGHAEGV